MMKRQIKILLTPFLLSFVFLGFYFIIDISYIITINWPSIEATIISTKIEEFPREVYKRGTMIDYRSECKIVIPSISANKTFNLIIPARMNVGDKIIIKYNPKLEIPVYIVNNTYSKMLLILFFICVGGGIIQILYYKKMRLI